MDRYFFEKFITPLDENILDGFFNFVLINAQEKVEIKNKGYYNYYPQTKREIQLVVETTQNDSKLNLDNFFFHHTSANVWKFKVINKLNDFTNTYMVSRKNGEGFLCLRLVNEAVLNKNLKEKDILEAQVVGLVITGHIYQTEQEYINSVPKNKKGQKYLMDDGVLMPINFLVNNNANLSEEERNTKDHFKDFVLSFKGKIKCARKHELHMFGTNLPDYYSVCIDTQYGELDIFFNKDVLNTEMKGFGKDNIIVGEMILSGDVCINKYNKYNKYIKNNDIKQIKN